MKSPRKTAKHTSGEPPIEERVVSLAPHILLLAQQATEQLTELSLTVDAGISLDTAVEPESAEDALETFAPAEQIAVMRRSIKAEMRRQVRALGYSIEAICTCATELKLRR
ncbi:hypothetical protein ACFJGX_20965 [Hydrogenophaga sp. UC242_50]|jgi:hypothetical protein|uniref:hypothetical protein n=1 Tax=unclassified Hydrogenophaga TaxID=2610897 RepID=UPI0036D4170F